jgi:cyanophycinase
MRSRFAGRLGALPLVATLAALGTPVASRDDGARGQLLIIGGGDRGAATMQLFACLAGGAQGRVLAFPQASERPEAGAEMRAELEALGIGRVTLAEVDRASADTAAAVALAAGITGVYLGGGDQSRLMAVLRGTRLAAALHRAYRDGAVMAGTSAGAAVMSRTMITGDERRPYSSDENWQTIEADNVVTAEGLGFLDDAVVDQHFVRRRRHNRLISVVLERPQLLGIAIDEETAVWVKPDRTFEVVGDGAVLVLDGSGARTARDAAGAGLRGSDLRLHVLRDGAQYDLARRAVVRLGPAVPGESASRRAGCASH